MRVSLFGFVTLALCAMLAHATAAAQTQAAARPVTATLPELARTPPMGWNSWNHFAGRVTDADVRSAADALVSTGMRDAGYVYVNVDDTWQGTRDAQGNMHPNKRFPDMKALGDSIHARGLKFGIYSSPGLETCGHYAGSLGHEEQDAATYASWGVDFLKYDLCSFRDQMKAVETDPKGGPEAANRLMIEAYRKMGKALAATGRPIVYSLCQYGWDDVWKWGPEVGAQMWRTTGDIDDSYARMMTIGKEQAPLARYAGPGQWNDPDMLEIGNGHMSAEEYRTHMSLWVLLAAPLLAGNDLAAMSAESKSILMNRDAIAIDQDPLGRQATRVSENGELSVWSRPLADGRVAVGMFNTGTGDAEGSCSLQELGFPAGAQVRDVWQGKDLGRHEALYSRHVAAHGVVLLLLRK